MFVVVYRWRLRPGFEASHRAGWRAVTGSIQRMFATGGSRLHRDADGAFIAYAVWPDQATYERAQAAPSAASEADRALMREGIDGAVEVLHRMTVIDDLLVALPGAADPGA
jgi:hypothetical protein